MCYVDIRNQATCRYLSQDGDYNVLRTKQLHMGTRGQTKTGQAEADMTRGYPQATKEMWHWLLG